MTARTIEDVLAEHKANPDPDGGYSAECDHGCGMFVIGVDWEAHLAAKVREWLLSDETVERAAVLADDDLLPAESMALTVALAQVRRGESPAPNIATACVLALGRVVGRYDWIQEEGS